MIEKPFGRDSETFEELNQLTASHFDERQLYRLDHYLGKEVVLNIASLRWANQLFEPTWNAQYIESVQLTFKEDLGTGGRGGYFDGFGIIRDIIQNHLLQAFMWLAMEPPSAMVASEIVAKKVELLSAVRALSLDEPNTAFLGQFGKLDDDHPGYLDDPTVPPGSTCPTFAATVLRVDNDRWRGVPFLFTAAKGMDERICEIRVRCELTRPEGGRGGRLLQGIRQQGSRQQPSSASPGPSSASAGRLAAAQVQAVGDERDDGGAPAERARAPRAAGRGLLYMITMAKEPGITAEQARTPVVMGVAPEASTKTPPPPPPPPSPPPDLPRAHLARRQVRKPVVMDMTYAAQFRNAYVGDAYERMFLNCARGDQSLFVSAAELVEAWRIFTPLLHQIDERKPQPVVHPFGIMPEGYASWAKANGIELRSTWHEFVAANGDHIDEMQKIFRELDVDGSNTLDLGEISELARRRRRVTAV